MFALHRNDTYIDPLFWIDAADEDSPKHRLKIPQINGTGDIGGTKKQEKQKSRHIRLALDKCCWQKYLDGLKKWRWCFRCVGS
jgi:hypothetical protein